MKPSHALLALAFAVAACSTTPHAAPTAGTNPPTTAATTTTPPPSPTTTGRLGRRSHPPTPPTKHPKPPHRDKFVSTVQAQLPEFAEDWRADEIRNFGQYICDALAGATDPVAIVAGLKARDVTELEAQGLIARARTTLCQA